MTPQFLRSEAARFREMAEAAEREASRLRLLAMADDYEARADAANETQPPEPVEDVEPEAVAEAVSEEPTEVKPERKRPGGRTLRLTR